VLFPGVSSPATFFGIFNAGKSMIVTQKDIQLGIPALGLAGKPVFLHSSLSSFGLVAGGADAVVGAFLDEGCTLLVPSFSSGFEIAPPHHLQFERNGWTYSNTGSTAPIITGGIYSPASNEIDKYMGAIPAAVLACAGRVRGNHPHDSFAGIGPLAAEIIESQAPLDVYAPFRALIRLDGFVLLAGVGLTRMTLLHLAEKEAGRNLFRRWARNGDGDPMAVEVGGCSEGFGNLSSYLEPVVETTIVGQSKWLSFPAGPALERAADVIRARPDITHCGDQACERCNDALAGGPRVDRVGRVD
jgi:aminoglycoside 3-N-acetyltransferase